MKNEILSHHKEMYPELTSKEFELVYYLALGLTIKEACFSLEISANTVKNYLKSVNNKLGFSNLTELKLNYHTRSQNWIMSYFLRTA